MWKKQHIFHCKTGQVCWWRNICIQRVSWWSPHVRFSTLNPRECSFCIYKHACFDILKKSLTITNSSSVNTLFSSCIILRSALSFGYHTNMALACLLKFFGIVSSLISVSVWLKNSSHDIMWWVSFFFCFFLGGPFPPFSRLAKGHLSFAWPYCCMKWALQGLL